MLVLTIRDGESVLIGESVVEVVVLRSHSGRTRLGIKAPLEIPVMRKAVHERLAAERQALEVEAAES